MAGSIFHNRPNNNNNSVPPRPKPAAVKRKSCCTNFIFKSLLVSCLFIVITLFPLKTPDSIEGPILSQFWELLYLSFVGIAVCYGIFSRRNIDPEVESTGSDSPMGSRDSGVPYPLCSEDEETIDALNSRYFRSDSDLGVAKMLNSQDVRPDFYDLGIPESVVVGGFNSNDNASGGLEFDDDLGHFNTNRKVGVENGHLAPQFWDPRPRILESSTPEFVHGKCMKGYPNSFGAAKNADFSEYSALTRGQKRHETSLGFNGSSCVTDSRETASLERESLGMQFQGRQPRTMDLGTPESIKSEEFDIGLKGLSNSSGIPEHGSFTFFSIPDGSQEYRGNNAGFYASPSPASSREKLGIENESLGLPFPNPGWRISDLSALESINSRKFNSRLKGLSNNFSIAENFNFSELFVSDDQNCEETDVRFYITNPKEEQMGTVCLPNSSYAAVPPEFGKTGRSNSTYTTFPSEDFQSEGFEDSENHKDANVRFYDTNSREEEVETICPSNSTSTTVTPEDFQIEAFEESLAAGSLRSHRSGNGFTEEVSLISSSDFRSQIEKGVKLLSQIPFPSCTSLVSSSPAMPPSFPAIVSSDDLSSSNLKSERRENSPSACVTSELLNPRTDELEGEGNFPFASVTESPIAVLDRKKSSPSRNSELLTPMNIRGIFKPKLHQHCYGSSSKSNLQNSLKNVSKDLHQQHVYGTSSKFNMLNTLKDGSKDLHQHGYDSSSKPCVSNSLKDVSEDLRQLGYGSSSNPNVSNGLHDGSKDLHQCSYHSSSMSNLHIRLKDVSQDLHQHSVGRSSKPNVPNILKDVSENLHQRAHGPSSKSKSNVLNSLKDVPEDLHQHGGVSSFKSNVLNSLKDESEDLSRNKVDLLEKEQLGLHFAKPGNKISVPASKTFPRGQAVSTVGTQNSRMKTERDGKTFQDGRDDNVVQKRQKELGVEVMNRTGRKSRGTEDPTSVPKDPKGEMDGFHENVFVGSGEVFQNKDDNFQSDINEIDKKAGEFIAKFREQMRVEKGPVNEVDKQAGDFIAKFKERIKLEKAATRSR